MKRVRILSIDVMSSGFILLNLLAIFASWNQIEQAWKICIPPFIFLLAIPLLAWADKQIDLGPRINANPSWQRQLFTIFRLGYPLMTMLYFYVTVYRYDNLIFTQMLDPWISSFDRAIFGYQPSKEWMLRFDSLWISEILHAAYFFYYLVLAAIPLYILFKNRTKLEESIFALMAVFYAACLSYILLPVAGGRFDPEVMVLTETMRHGPFTRIMAFLYRQTDHFGAAFPSTHVAMSSALAISAFRLRLPLRSVVLINALLVAVASVYGGYHYFADVILGFVYAGIFYPLGLALYRRISVRLAKWRSG